MKEIEKFKLDEEVVVDGFEGIYVIQMYFEQKSSNESFELWYTVKGKIHGDLKEVSYQKVRSAKEYEHNITNELLDKYNDYMELHQVFGDREYKDKADYIMDKLKYKI